MDINWEQIQQLLTFLIIFIAPAILSKFKKREDSEEEKKETPLTKLRFEEMAGTKPIILEELRKEDKRKQKEQSLSIEQLELRRQKELVAKAKITELRKASAVVPTKPKVSKKNEILGLSPQKAFVLKEVLSKPRGLDPF